MGSYDVTALGELLIDFTENGVSGQGNPLFEANPGGAPCNLLAMLQKAGCKTAFIGKVGEDMFGDMLETRAGSTGIDLSGLVKDPEINTTLAFVHTLEGGDREFSFYRKPGADMMLTAEEVEENASLIRDARIFHFGTLSMTHDTVAAASEKAISIAEEAGCIRSFDPNLLHGQRLIFSHLPDGITFRHIVFPAEDGNGIFIQVFLIWRFQKDTLPFYRGQSV